MCIICQNIGHLNPLPPIHLEADDPGFRVVSKLEHGPVREQNQSASSDPVSHWWDSQ